jgi:uncharacterized protein YukE
VKKLSKDDKSRRDEIIGDFKRKWADVDEQAAVVQQEIDKLNEKIALYNGVIDEAHGFRDDMISAMDDYIGERSEKWADGDAGQAYSSWYDEWQGFDPVEVDAVEDFDLEEPDHADVLEALPEQPE